MAEIIETVEPKVVVSFTPEELRMLKRALERDAEATQSWCVVNSLSSVLTFVKYGIRKEC